MFSPGDSHLQKLSSRNLYLNTWRQIKFQQNRDVEGKPTTWRLVGLRQVWMHIKQNYRQR